MTLQEFLFSFTFVFGVLYLLTHLVVFRNNTSRFFEALYKAEKMPILLKYLDCYLFYLSLFYQSLFWAKYFNILN